MGAEDRNMLAVLMNSVNNGNIPRNLQQRYRKPHQRHQVWPSVARSPRHSIPHRGLHARRLAVADLPHLATLNRRCFDAYIAPHTLAKLTPSPGNHLSTHIPNILGGAQPRGLEVLQHRHAVPRFARLAERSFCARARGRHGERC